MEFMEKVQASSSKGSDGEPRSIIKIQPRIQWPSLGDGSTGPKDVEDFFIKLEDPQVDKSFFPNEDDLEKVQPDVTLRLINYHL